MKNFCCFCLVLLLLLAVCAQKLLLVPTNSRFRLRFLCVSLVWVGIIRSCLSLHRYRDPSDSYGV